MELKFDAEIWKAGNANVVTVPVAYLKNGLMQHDKKYEFVVREKVAASAEPQEGTVNGQYGTFAPDLSESPAAGDLSPTALGIGFCGVSA